MARPGLTSHRKFHRLVRMLSEHVAPVHPRVVARGILEMVWEPSYESGEDYLGTADDIEALVGWTGAKGALAKALADCGKPEGFGFLEPIQASGADQETRYKIHDLWHHAPDYVQKRRSRELERREKQAPKPQRRRSADTDHQSAPTLDWQNEVDGTPAPAHAPAHAPGTSGATAPTAHDVVAIWNEVVTSPIPKVTRLTSDRETKINARLQSFPDLSTWRTVIVWINGQDWCRKPGRGEHPNWCATLDWLVKSDGNVVRQLERAEADTAAARKAPVLEVAASYIDDSAKYADCRFPS